MYQYKYNPDFLNVLGTYPVIGMTNSFSASSLVTSISSPRPNAACSLNSADPLIRP